MDDQARDRARAGDAALDLALRQMALGVGDGLDDGGFTLQVMRRIPVRVAASRRGGLVFVCYLAGVSLAAAASLLSLFDFVTAVSSDFSWRSADVWLSVAASLAILSWLCVGLTDELIAN
jgi:hypothetical protein